MACGLPLELARKVVYQNKKPLFVSPTAQMMKDMVLGGSEWASTGLDMFNERKDYAVRSNCCMCQWYEAGDWTGRAAARHCRGMSTPIGRATPISVAAACHSQTIYQWRGTWPLRHYKWIMKNHDWNWGQLWENRRDDYCGMTLLYYRLWRTMNERDDCEEMPIMPREYSLVRRLKEADMSELRQMLRDATGEAYACLKLLRPGYNWSELVRHIIAAN